MRDPYIHPHFYAEVVRLWGHRMDTVDISRRVNVPEHIAARWVANFRDVMQEAASA